MKRIYFLLLSAFFCLAAMAQNGGGADINVDITKSSGNSAGFPWLWVIGGVVFVLLLVALLSGRGTDRVIEKRTVIKE